MPYDITYGTPQWNSPFSAPLAFLSELPTPLAWASLIISVTLLLMTLFMSRFATTSDSTLASILTILALFSVLTVSMNHLSTEDFRHTPATATGTVAGVHDYKTQDEWKSRLVVVKLDGEQRPFQIDTAVGTPGLITGDQVTLNCNVKGNDDRTFRSCTVTDLRR